MKIQPIVEGHGEVQAVPILLRRLCEEAKVYDVEIARPIRRKQSELIGKDGVQKSVRLALLQSDCSAVLILFDSEDSCPKNLAPKIQKWAQAAAGQTPCNVVLAYREYETWFLMTVESLRGKCGIQQNAVPPHNPEAKRGAKEALEQFMPRGSSYDETVDQAKLTAAFDMTLAHKSSRSFRKMVKAFGVLMAALGCSCHPWPPPGWLQGV